MLFKILLVFFAVGYVHGENLEPTLQYKIGKSQVFVFDNVMHPRFGSVLQELLAA